MPERRSTRQGQVILQALDAAPGFLSAQDLHARLRSGPEPVGLTTVYRHLGLMAADGVVDAVTVADGSVLYRRCRADQHHHHLVCRRCGAGVEVQADEVEDWAARAARKAGFTDVTHTLEVFGTCRACRQASRE